jgi:hypothetical protein
LPLWSKNTLYDFPRINLQSGAFLILCITILFIGFRDPYGSWRYLGDTANYSRTFANLNESTYGKKKDIGFYFLMYFSKKFLNLQLFYLLCALIYVVPVYVTFKKWFNQYAYFALLLFVTSLSFWGFGVNGLRNGLATSIFIYALGFQNKKLLQYGLLILAISFHNSMILPFVSYVLATYYTNTKSLIKIWLCAVVVSYFLGRQLESFFESLLLIFNLSDDIRVEGIFAESLDGVAVIKTYRFDFILYSSIALFIGCYYKYKLNYKSIFYDKILNTYIIANTVWILLIYIAYTNRTAYLSWFLIPIVLLYPLLRENFKINRVKFIRLMIIGSLLFTLITQFK